MKKGLHENKMEAMRKKNRAVPAMTQAQLEAEVEETKAIAVAAGVDLKEIVGHNDPAEVVARKLAKNAAVDARQALNKK